MKKIFSIALLTLCIAFSVHGADGPNVKALIIPSFQSLNQALKDALGENPNYSKVLIGIDFDETVAIKSINEHLLKAEVLLNGELKTIDDYAYQIATEAKKEVGLREDEPLFTDALKKGGYIKLLRNMLPEDVATNIEPHTVAKDLRENASYIYTEEQDVIKDALKPLQKNGAFVAIASAGAGTPKRELMAQDVGIRKGFWAFGPSKFRNLTALFNEKHKSFGRGQDDYDTVVLVDNAQSGVTDFIAAARKAAKSNSNIKNIVAIKYDNPDHKITKSKILKEYNAIARTNFPTGEERPSLGYGLQYLGY